MKKVRIGSREDAEMIFSSTAVKLARPRRWALYEPRVSRPSMKPLCLDNLLSPCKDWLCQRFKLGVQTVEFHGAHPKSKV